MGVALSSLIHVFKQELLTTFFDFLCLSKNFNSNQEKLSSRGVRAQRENLVMVNEKNNSQEQIVNRVDELAESVAKIEARMKTHWALQTDDEFADHYIQRIKNELHSSIVKMAIGAIVLLAGSGYIFIQYAVSDNFSSKNASLISQLEKSYNKQIERTDENFEWRRFHDYGKDYANLAELYSLSSIPENKKEEKIHKLLDEAENYFNKSLLHGDMHASTYWELGELKFSYPKEMRLAAEIDRLSAIEDYENAAIRYTDVEIEKGWRAEAYYKMGFAFHELASDLGHKKESRQKYLKQAKTYLYKAKTEYSRVKGRTDERAVDNIKHIGELLSAINK